MSAKTSRAFFITGHRWRIFHDDGSWVDENALLITLCGIPRKTVYEIAKDLCTFFHQESVMITCNQVVRFNTHDWRGS